MHAAFRTRLLWLALVAAPLALAIAAPLAAAAGPELRAAPLSAAFLRYQADFRLRHTLGLDRVPGFRPGLVPAPKDVSDLKGARIAPPMVTYAPAFDLRSANKVSPVKDQNPYGTCWAFATYGSLESCLLPGELRDLSEDNLVLNAGFDVGGDPYNYGGNYGMSSAYLIRWSGPVDESQDAYGDFSTPPGLSAGLHVQEIRDIPGGASATDTANIKYALTTYGAVATSISWQSSAYRSTTASFYYSGGASTNHAVTIVGWDDDYSASDFVSPAPGNGAWLVKNSWGAGWGQSGYFWTSYYDRYCGSADVRNAVFTGSESTGSYGDIYTYDPLGEVGDFGYGQTTAWGANVFTAHEDQSIGALGFFAVTPDTTYTVYAGGSLASLQALGSGSFSTPGFHTVALSSPLGVVGGSPFAVAVRLTTPGNGYPLAVEYAVAGYSSGATASPGQSYISSSGSTWNDLTGWDSTANFCLNAYATAGSPPTDTTPPLTTAVGHDALWHRRPVRITFSAGDPAPGASGVAYTEYRIGGGVWQKGDEVTVGAPASGGGTRTVDYRSADNAGNVENAHRLGVKIDVVGPVCRAKSASVRRGGLAVVRFTVNDNVSPSVKFTVKVRTTSGVTKQTFGSNGWRRADYWRSRTFRCWLRRGTYRIYVYGSDLAGNSQSVVGRATLTVR